MLPVAARTLKKILGREKMYVDLRFQGKNSNSKTRDLRASRVQWLYLYLLWCFRYPTSILNSYASSKHRFVFPAENQYFLHGTETMGNGISAKGSNENPPK